MATKEELQACLVALETERKEVQKMHLIPLLGLVIAIAFSAIGIQEIGALLGIGVAAYGAWTIGKKKSAYRKRYKSEIVGQIVKNFNPDWKFFPNRGIGRDMFRKSGLFKKGDRYREEDLIEGQLESTAFLCSEVHTEERKQRRVSTKNGSRTETTWETIFQGLFFHADCNKHFQGHTIVIPDKLEKFLGRFGNALQKFQQSMPLVRMEDPRFERAFAVHSTNDQEARYLITPALMETMLLLRSKLGAGVRFAFVDGRICCAIPVNRNLFEPRVWRSGVNMDDVALMERMIALNSKLIESLDLNTRIWTKE